jgi:YD repeat-containing protein
MAQIEPLQSGEEFLDSLNVSKVSVSYYPSTDTAKNPGKLILEKEYDGYGNITKKYLLSLWEAVSYSKASTFAYNEIGQLTEVTTMQKILNLEKRDEDYINSFGDKPLHEKIKYEYNPDGLLSKKTIYTFSSSTFPKDAVPRQVIIYTYENGLLVKEESSSPDKVMFNQNYTIEYQYNDLKQLRLKTMSYGSERKNKRTTSFQYDGTGNVIEEEITDNLVARNSGRFRYEYDENGLVKNVLEYDNTEAEFLPQISYAYDEHGNKTSGMRDVAFEYYQNGLIKSELWKDDISEQLFFFVTRYVY